MKDIFLLDMDETLLDFSRTERENFSRTLKAFGIAEGEGMYARFHAINDSLWKLLERGGIERERLLYERFRILFEEYAIACDFYAVGEAFYENYETICFPYPGARAFVEELAARGRVYIVTNGGRKIQRAHIAAAGFAGALSGVFISDEMGVNKPSFEYAARVKEGIPSFEEGRAVWFGDSLTSDMVCAERMNVDFVRFYPDRDPPEQYRAFLRSLG